jgi:hypothetical protein
MMWMSRVVAALSLLMMAVPSGGHELEAYTLLSVAPVDGKAVVQLSGGQLQILSVDDVVPGTHATVQQVLPDRLVLFESVQSDEAEQAGERRTVWWFKAKAPGQKSRVQVLSRTAPDEPDVLAPNTAVEDSRSPPEKTDSMKEEEEGGPR